jgi:hypothetical protein
MHKHPYAHSYGGCTVAGAGYPRVSPEAGLTNLCDDGACPHMWKLQFSFYMYPGPRISIQSSSEARCLRGRRAGKRYFFASIRAELCRILDMDFRERPF